MAFQDQLVQTIYAYRRDNTVDRLGQPNKPDVTGAVDWSGPCRLSTKRGGRVQGDRAVLEFEDTYTVFLSAGADVREDDLVRVTDSSGDNLLLLGIVNSRYDVWAGTSTVHHVELDVFEQTASQDEPGKDTTVTGGGDS